MGQMGYQSPMGHWLTLVMGQLFSRGLTWYEESGGGKEPTKNKSDSDDVIKITKKFTKTEVGGQMKEAPVNGVIFVEGRKLCKHCGNSLED